MPSNPPIASEDYQAPSDLPLSPAVWAAVIGPGDGSIAARLRQLEAVRATFDELIAQGTSEALALIAQTVAPQLLDLRQQIDDAQTQLNTLLSGGYSVTAAEKAALDAAMSVQSFGDVAATISSSATTVFTAAALTAPRAWTLPAASAVAPMTPLRVMDIAGAISATNTLTITAAGTDTINGATSVMISAAYASLTLQSNGASKWSCDGQIFPISRGGTGATDAKAALVNLGIGRVRRYLSILG